MRRFIGNPARSRRGYATLIGLMLVLAVIGVLVYRGFFQGGSAGGEPVAATTTDRARDTTCFANQGAIRSELAQAQAESSERMSADAMRGRIEGMRRCPGSGRYQVDGAGNVYCSEHAPAPESVATLHDLD